MHHTTRHTAPASTRPQLSPIVRRLKLVKAAPALTPAHRLLLREIVDFLGNADTCWPSLRLLAHNCGLTTRRIRQLLRDLERGGWIATRPRLRTDGGRTSSEYHWIATAPDHGAAETPLSTATTSKITVPPTATRSTPSTAEKATPEALRTLATEADCRVTAEAPPGNPVPGPPGNPVPPIEHSGFENPTETHYAGGRQCGLEVCQKTSTSTIPPETPSTPSTPSKITVPPTATRSTTEKIAPTATPEALRTLATEDTEAAAVPVTLAVTAALMALRHRTPHPTPTAPDHGAAETPSTPSKITTTPTATRSTPSTAEKATPEARTPRRWLTIDPAQFSNPAEALRVYQATVAAGLLTTSEVDRLSFFSAWCYCSRRHRTGKVTHPERMMQFLLRRPKTLRAIPAAEDEQKAREAVRRLFH